MKKRPKKPKTSPETREPRVEMKDIVQVAVSYAGDGFEVFGTVRDLNLQGMLVLCQERFPAESICRFRLMIEGEMNDVVATGWVVRELEKGMAVQFDELSPETQGAITRTLERLTIGSR